MEPHAEHQASNAGRPWTCLAPVEINPQPQCTQDARSSFHGAAAASTDAGEHAGPGNSSTMASRSSPSTAPVPSDLAAVGNGTDTPGSMPPRAHPSPSPHLLAVAAGALVSPI